MNTGQRNISTQELVAENRILNKQIEHLKSQRDTALNDLTRIKALNDLLNELVTQKNNELGELNNSNQNLRSEIGELKESIEDEGYDEVGYNGEDEFDDEDYDDERKEIMRIEAEEEEARLERNRLRRKKKKQNPRRTPTVMEAEDIEDELNMDDFINQLEDHE